MMYLVPWSWMRRVLVVLAWTVAVVVGAAAAIAFAKLVDSVLVRHSPAWLDEEAWLWLRWCISVFLALGFAVGIYVGARRRWRGGQWLTAVPASIVVVAVLAPLGWAYAAHGRANPEPVPHADLTPVTDLDILVVTRATAPNVSGPPAPLDRTEWDTRWTVAVVDPNGVRVLLGPTNAREDVVAALVGERHDIEARIVWRPKARHIVLFDPYPTPAVVAGGGIAPPPGDLPASPGRLGETVAQLAPPDASVFALLRAHVPTAVRARWQAWAKAEGGGALVVGSHGTETLADVGWRAAIAAPGDDDDAALAWRFRPRLLFDEQAASRESEGYMPINVDEFIISRRPNQCRAVGVHDEECVVVTRPDEVDGFYDFLDTRVSARDPTGGSFPPTPPTPPSANNPPQVGGAPPTMGPTFDCSELPPGIPPPPTCASKSPLYWFVRRRGKDIYVGYWWFFPFNPTPVFRRSTCDPLVGLSNVVCFDHASDWEGITVVVRKQEDGSVQPEAVIYEQHGKMMRRNWSWLKDRWDNSVEDERPLVYVASGSHASYPEPCPSNKCKQPPFHPNRIEGPYDGQEPWPNNDGVRCSNVCLLRLPVTAGRDPALWNAFPGRWGRRICIWWDAVCTQTSGPRSPGHTDRFLQPWVEPTVEDN